MLFSLTQVDTYYDRATSSIRDFPYSKCKQNLLFSFSNVSLKLENPNNSEFEIIRVSVPISVQIS